MPSVKSRQDFAGRIRQVAQKIDLELLKGCFFERSVIYKDTFAEAFGIGLAPAQGLYAEDKVGEIIAEPLFPFEIGEVGRFFLSSIGGPSPKRI